MENKTANAIAREMWLKYFNQYLFEHGIIDEQTRNRMKFIIETNHTVPNTAKKFTHSFNYYA